MQIYTITYFHGIAYEPGYISERIERMEVLPAYDEFSAVQKFIDLLCKMILFRGLRYVRHDSDGYKIEVYRKDDESGLEYVCDTYREFQADLLGYGHYNFKTIDEQRKELDL